MRARVSGEGGSAHVDQVSTKEPQVSPLLSSIAACASKRWPERGGLPVQSCLRIQYLLAAQLASGTQSEGMDAAYRVVSLGAGKWHQSPSREDITDQQLRAQRRAGRSMRDSFARRLSTQSDQVTPEVLIQPRTSSAMFVTRALLLTITKHEFPLYSLAVESFC